MSVDVRMAGPADAGLFDRVAPDVFDGPTDPQRVIDYLADPRLHIAIAVNDDRLVGMCSGVDYFHPDKPPELFINELGVSPAWQRKGIATRLLTTLLAHGKKRSCTEAWVLADNTEEALGFYRSTDAEETGQHHTMFTFDLKNRAF